MTPNHSSEIQKGGWDYTQLQLFVTSNVLLQSVVCAVFRPDAALVQVGY